MFVYDERRRDAAADPPAMAPPEADTSRLGGMSFDAASAELSPLVAERRAHAEQLAANLRAKISGSPGAGAYQSQVAFFLDILPDAVVSQLSTEVPASITLSQAAIETGYGRSVPPGNNMFGIKGAGPAGSVELDTREEVDGQLIDVRDRFRRYDDRSESFVDHARLLSENPRYADAMAAREDPDAMATELQQAGYATDSDYPGKLRWIMDTFALREIDPLVRRAAAQAITPDEALEAFGREPGDAGGERPGPAVTPTPTPATPRPTPAPATDERAYVVRPGDTLSKIAADALGDARRYGEIARLNGIADPNLIRVGQRLRVPEAAAAPAPETRSYTVRAGETLSIIARRELGDARRYTEIARLSGLRDPNLIQTGQILQIPAA